MQPLRLALIALVCHAAFSLGAQQNIGIGTTMPNASAILDITSTNKGVLIPRAETAAIASPVAGLIIYQPSDNAVYYHNGTGWQKLSGGSIVDADGDTRITALNATGSVDSILFEIDNQKKLVLKRTPGGDLMMEPVGLSLNTFFGNDAGQSLSTGSFNSGYGAHALKSNQHGNFNTGIGYEALTGNTSGTMNTALGASSLSQNTFGNFNTASGVSALQMNTTGSNNVASGHNALKTNSSGNSNTGIGTSSLMANTTGNTNTGIGSSSLMANTVGNTNTAVGASSLAANTQGNSNTGSGASSLASNTTGSGNVAAGYGALKSNTTANANVAFGRESLSNVTTVNQLVAVGDSALHFNQLGWVSIQDGSQNTAVGSKAMLKNTLGKWNAAFGYHAMRENISGVNNSAFGNNAFHKHTAGSANTAIGSDALWGHLTGDANTAVGNGAIGLNQTGANNIALGWRTGFNNLTGSSNIFIGTQAGYDELGSNKLYIENSSANASNALIYGDFNTNLLRFNAHAEINTYDPGQTGLRSHIQAPPGTYQDVAAVYGENTVDDFYGLGVVGKSGYIGVLGEVTGTTGGAYYGVRGQTNGAHGGTNYAVYGDASGGSQNYGGYFNGRGYFSSEVGIGIDPPAELLHLRAITDPTILIQSLGNGGMAGKLSLRESDFTGVDVFYDGTGTTDALVFESYSGGTSNGRKFTMDLSGNVGIGITENIAAGHKLSVNGKIACTEVRVQPQSEWPDYVFSTDYQLMPLAELKTSIEKNNHLPGIPSATEIQNDGLQVGDMQVRMMEKIEELTLYILQLNAAMEKLTEENKQQAAEIASLMHNTK